MTSKDTSEGINAVLTDLSLPYRQGMDTVDRLLLAAPHVPILVFSGMGDECIASQAVQHGAQDYHSKDHLDSHTLSRALRIMIDRKTAEDALFTEGECTQVMLYSIGNNLIAAALGGRPRRKKLLRFRQRTRNYPTAGLAGGNRRARSGQLGSIGHPPCCSSQIGNIVSALPIFDCSFTCLYDCC
jgi:hypothetical protein